MAIFDINNTDLILGEYEEFDTISVSQHEFSLSQDERRRHIYAIGQTGTGKTTLLENLVLQDIYAGRGVTLIDPHGDTRIFGCFLLFAAPAKSQRMTVSRGL